MKIAKWLNESKIPTYKGIIGGWRTFQVKQILKIQNTSAKTSGMAPYTLLIFPAILRASSISPCAGKIQSHDTDAYLQRK